MSISSNGFSPRLATIALLYDTSAKLLGEAIQMEKKSTKVGATRVRKLLNEAGRNVKLARKEFREYTMEKFGVQEDSRLCSEAQLRERCIKCNSFLPKESLESNVVVCERCGSEPYEAREDKDAPIDSPVEN